jgi:hypothetical protein
MASRPAGPPTPECKTVLTCERIVIDARTGLSTLFNVFSSFTIQGKPGRTGAFSLFVQLTGGLGEYEVAAEFHDLDEGKTLHRNDGKIGMVDRLELVIVYFDFEPIVIPGGARLREDRRPPK